MRFIKKKRVVLLLVILCLILARHINNKNQVFYEPEYKRADISETIRCENISDDEYLFIYKQTGVSPYAAREFIKKEEFSVLERLNKLYFEKPEAKLDYIFYPFTAVEINSAQTTPIVDLKNGDILITFNTHTLDWRHGHCGLVVDAEKGILLEHMSVGETSCLTDARDWGSYPAFLVLRHRNEAIAAKAADFAYKNLVDVNYNIFAGLINKDKSKSSTIDSSHCSHIVWQAYKALDVDLDYNGGGIVTPREISLSDVLEVVQIYGIDPKDYADRIMK